MPQIIDNWSHVGGLLTGMLLAAFIPPPVREYSSGTAKEAPSQAVVLIPIVVVALAMSGTVRQHRASGGVTRLLQEGRRLRASLQSGKAMEKFQEAAHLAPGDERPHEELGAIYLDQHRILEAIQEYQEALRLNPGSQGAQLGLAVAFERQGNPARAQQLLEGLLGKNPGTAGGHQLLGDLCLQQKLYPEAIRHYEEALRLSPDLAPVHNNFAWLLATAEDTHLRDPRRALQHAHRAVELTKWKEATFIDTLAEALYANGSFQQAVQTQTKALELDPRNQEYQDHMARYRKAAGA
jgi:tetratricopeptide (TPR) repeat protein